VENWERQEERKRSIQGKKEERWYLAPSDNRSTKSADGRVATGAAWLKGRNSQGEREEQKHPYRKQKKEKLYLTLTGLLMEGSCNRSW
jgi:hypothetical protein